ncbi:MAG: AMP-binding protein [Planctomycetaceae bacterium]|nr:AMP-binding protein [Planctomycetaceae bacterium]
MYKNAPSDHEPDERHNVGRLLAEVAEQTPEKLALVLPERLQVPPISFGDLWNRAGRLADSLNRTGLKTGDRVIVMVPMSIDLYVVLLGLIRLGCVAVFVDPWMPLKRIAKFAEYAEPKAFIGIPKSHLIRWLQPSLRRLPITVSTAQTWGGWISKYGLNKLLRESSIKASLAAVRLTDSALITFTSGSSGEPKGANRTHQFLLAQHRALAKEFPYLPTDVDLPMFPVFALNNLVSGVTSIVPDMDFRRVAAVNGTTIYEQMLKHRVTTCTASPPLLDRLASTGLTKELPLRRILTGGAPISDSQLEKWHEAFPQAKIVVAYGSTEAEPVADIDSHERLQLEHPRDGFCMGRPIAAIDTRIIPIQPGPIVDPNWEDDCRGSLRDPTCIAEECRGSLRDPTLVRGANHDIRTAERSATWIGELIVSGDHVCRDYYRNQAATRENKLVDRNQRLWHRMGDTGYFDTEGRFWLVGRVHSSIHRAGEWLHPQLIEQRVAERFPQVKQVAAVGYPDAELEQGLALLVVAAPGVVEVAQIQSALAEANYPCDRCLILQEPLPVDPRHNLKIDYEQARKLLIKSFGNSDPNRTAERSTTIISRTEPVTAASPFWSRWAAYSRERFPVLKHGILIACFYSSTHFLAQVLADPSRSLSYDLGSLMGMLTLFLFFFHLRVFDEHKDFAEDSRYYPHRVLQRGIVSLRELRWLGAGAIGLQLLMAWLWRPLPQAGALVSLVAAMLFSFLMLKEFFVPRFLKQHFLLYAVSHLLIMPLLAMIVFSFTTGEYLWAASPWFWLYSCVGFFVTFNWEISRKIRAPEQEIDGVDSYTKLLGRYGAAWWVLAMRVIDTALVMIVGWHLQASLWFYLALVLLFVGCLFGFVKYMREQTPTTAGQMETWAGWYIIAFDLILSIELVTRYGLRLEWFPE